MGQKKGERERELGGVSLKRRERAADEGGGWNGRVFTLKKGRVLSNTSRISVESSFLPTKTV